MMEIDKLVARRGRPDTFASDNGTNFVSASKEVNTRKTLRRLLWKLNTPSAHNQGGAW